MLEYYIGIELDEVGRFLVASRLKMKYQFKYVIRQGEIFKLRL